MPRTLRFLSTHPALRQNIFYVDATTGNDANDGLLPSKAWQSISKVNGTTFRAGARVLFKRGEVWAGTTLNGASNVTYGAYHSGARPKIDGNNTVNCFVAANKSNIRLEYLQLARGLDHGAKFDACDHVTVVDCEMNGAGNDNLIFINGCTVGRVYGGIYRDAYVRVVGYLVSGIEIADNGSDFIIDSAECYGSAHVGITVHNHGTADAQGSTNIPQNVIIRNVNCHNNSTHGLNIMSQGPTVAANISIEHSRFENNTQEGIRCARAGGALGTNDVPANVTISECTALGNSRYGIYLESDDTTVKRCQITSARFLRAVDCKRLNIYNNTIYAAVWGGFHPIYIDGARGDTITIKNNIVLCDETAAQNIALTGTFAPATKTVVIDYNLWAPNSISNNRLNWSGTAYTFANWKTNTGQDAHSPTPADPKFTNKVTNDFSLQATSPALNAGTVISGVTDGYYGIAPDLGATERAT
jgi:hypothetical protein